jgi:hypothetical protein
MGSTILLMVLKTWNSVKRDPYGVTSKGISPSYTRFDEGYCIANRNCQFKLEKCVNHLDISARNPVSTRAGDRWICRQTMCGRDPSVKFHTPYLGKVGSKPMKAKQESPATSREGDSCWTYLFEFQVFSAQGEYTNHLWKYLGCLDCMCNQALD